MNYGRERFISLCIWKKYLKEMQEESKERREKDTENKIKTAN